MFELPRGMMAGVPVPLFETHPEFCPYDHRLGPGRMVRGWLPCICEGALPGRGQGHLWVKCRTCEDAGRTTFYYEGPHVDGPSTQPGGLILEAGAGLWCSYTRA